MEMDIQAQKIKPIGNMVLIKFYPIEEKEDFIKKGKLFVPGAEKKVGQEHSGSMGKKYRSYVEAIGEKVDPNECNFKVGDWVIFNNYDLMSLEIPRKDDPTEVDKYGLTKPESIWGVFIPNDEKDGEKGV